MSFLDYYHELIKSDLCRKRPEFKQIPEQLHNDFQTAQAILVTLFDNKQTFKIFKKNHQNDEKYKKFFEKKSPFLSFLEIVDQTILKEAKAKEFLQEAIEKHGIDTLKLLAKKYKRIQQLQDELNQQHNNSANSNSLKKQPEVKIRQLGANLPANVDKADLKRNDCLLTANEIRYAEKLLAKKYANSKSKAGTLYKLSKEESGLDYTIIKLNGKNYAVYKGDFNHALGEGGFGKVKLMQAIDAPYEWAALKTIFSEKSEYVQDEYKNLVSFKQHRGIAYHDNEEKFLLGMKYIHGTTLSNLSKKKLPANSLLEIINQLFITTQKFHGHGFLHRDIKPNNVLYDPITNKTKLVDVGIAVRSRDGKFVTQGDVIGTESFIAPELRITHTYNEKTEVFALGMTIAKLLKVVDRNDLTHILDAEYADYSHLPKELLKKIIPILLRMTDRNPNVRCTLQEAMADFKALSAQYSLSLLNDIRSIGVANINEITDHHGKLRKEFIAPLQTVNQVWLYGATEKSHANLLAKELIDNNIMVSGILPVKEDEFDDSVAENMEISFSKSQEKLSVNNYFHISKNPQINILPTLTDGPKFYGLLVEEDATAGQYLSQLDQPLVIEEQINIIKAKLTTEAARLKNHYFDENDILKKRFLINGATVERKIFLLENTAGKLQGFFEDGLLSHSKLKEELVNLEKKMIHANSLIQSFSKIFGFKSISAKAINELANATKAPQEQIEPKNNTSHTLKK